MEPAVLVENNSSNMSPEMDMEAKPQRTLVEDTPPLPTKKLSFGDAASIRKSSLYESENKLRVYLRIKPRNDTDLNAGEQREEFDKEPGDTLVCLDKSTIQVNVPDESRASRHRNIVDRYSFKEVFTKSAAQQDVFEETTKPLISTLFQGKDGLLFAYGVTNAGKTYTVEGTTEQPGIIPRTLDEVFRMCNDENSKSDAKYTVSVSYLQVYNEKVQDLQHDMTAVVDAVDHQPSRPNLRILHNKQRVEVQGLKVTPIGSSQEALDVLEAGKRQRTTHETNLNSTSSRSHAVFILYLNRTDPSTNKTTSSRLYLVDLAGTERKKRTRTTYARHHEATKINVSLMFLMKCFNEIRVNQRIARLYPDRKPNVIPYRASELTKLFRGCLCGPKSGMIVMIVNASAEPCDFDETVKALNYGELARSVNVTRPPLPSQSNLPVKQVVQYDLHGRKVYTTTTMEEDEAEETDNKENESKNIDANDEQAWNDSSRRLSTISQHGGENTSSNLNSGKSSIVPTRLSLEMAKLAEQSDMYRQSGSDSPGRPSTGSAWEGEEYLEDSEEERLRLQRELAEARAQHVMLEAEIREEVSKEMASRLQEMEKTFRKRIDYARSITENKAAQMMENLSKRMEVHDDEDEAEGLDVDEIKAQVLECEAEMRRMHEIHSLEVESLRNELAAMSAMNQQDDDDNDDEDDGSDEDGSEADEPDCNEEDNVSTMNENEEEQKSSTPQQNSKPKSSSPPVTGKRKSSAGSSDSDEAYKRIRELLDRERESHQRTTMELQAMRTKWQHQVESNSVLRIELDEKNSQIAALQAHLPTDVTSQIEFNIKRSTSKTSRPAKRKSGEQSTSPSTVVSSCSQQPNDNNNQTGDLQSSNDSPDSDEDKKNTSLTVPPMFTRTKEYATIADLWKSDPTDNGKTTASQQSNSDSQHPTTQNSEAKRIRNSSAARPTPEKLRTTSKVKMLQLERERNAIVESSKKLASKMAVPQGKHDEHQFVNEVSKQDAVAPPIPARTFNSKHTERSKMSHNGNHSPQLQSQQQEPPISTTSTVQASTPQTGSSRAVENPESKNGGSARSVLGWVREALSSQKKSKTPSSGARSLLSPGRGAIGFFKGAIGSSQQSLAPHAGSKASVPTNKAKGRAGTIAASGTKGASPMVPVARRTRAARAAKSQTAK